MFEVRGSSAVEREGEKGGIERPRYWKEQRLTYHMAEECNANQWEALLRPRQRVRTTMEAQGELWSAEVRNSKGVLLMRLYRKTLARLFLFGSLTL